MMGQMRRQLTLALVLAVKDWRLFLADRKAAVSCFVVPVLLASVFGVIFQRCGDRLGRPRLPLLVANEDDSALSCRVVADLIAHPDVDARVLTRAEAEAVSARPGGGVALVFPAGFGAALERKSGPAVLTSFSRDAGPAAGVLVLHHPLAALESQWAEGLVTEVVMGRVVRQALGPLAPAEGVALKRPFSVERVALGGDDGRSGAPFDAFSHSFCGMALQYLLFWGMESGLVFLRERQRGLWRRTQAAPVGLWAVLLGKVISTGAVALAQVGVTFLFGYLVFGVSVTGSASMFVALALGVSALSASAGLLVAALGGTEARARSVCILVILTLAMVGGLWLPSFLLPGWVQGLAAWLPTTWAMRGLDGVTWQGLGWSSLWPSLLMVWGFNLVFLGAAAGRLAWLDRQARRGGAR